ncbi:MAG TPA: tetratricopeptide repeat protein [Chitinophagaceae bacterium]|nr:tetratricopeptide repeat protein [Chitinophagaceae bacterium]
MSVKKILALFTVTFTMIPVVKSQDMEDAKQLIENGRYTSAEKLLEKNIGTDAPEPEANYLLVKTYLEQEKTEEAARFVNKYLQAAEDGDADPLNRIAATRYLLNAGNKRAADEIFNSILTNRKYNKNVSLLLAMAEVAVEEKNGDAWDALTWLDLAEKKDRRNPDIEIVRGLAYRKLKDANNAYIAFQQAIKKDPRNARAHYLLGKIFTAQKNPEIYMEHFEKAYMIDSTYAPVLEALYNHYYFRNVQTAKKFLGKYIANSDYSIQNDYYMTDLLYLNGEYQEAVRSANEIIGKEQEKTQPRIFKLAAYAYTNSGDSAKALSYMKRYFEKETPEKVIAADFRLIAQLTEKVAGQEEAAISYYSISTEMDTVIANKAANASVIAELYKKTGNNAARAEWLGKYYGWKDRAGNVDLFNWGLAWYLAKDYRKTDSVFTIYTTRYPDDIYGYYWRAQANASIDTAMADSLAIPFYRNVVAVGEKNKEANKKMLLKAYAYLGGYEANITKNYEVSLAWFEKYIEMEENARISTYIEMLHKWMAERNKE